MKKRDQIKMTAEEERKFLEEAKTMILVSNGRDGYPHPVPMWLVIRDGMPIMSTYGSSQKVLNLRRDPRVTALVEAGEQYEELRGVMIRGRAEIVEDRPVVEDVQVAFAHKYVGGPFPEGAEDLIRARAAKRVAIRIIPERITSWDHSKLGGGY